ncbi:stage V sporulation protein D [Clostridium acetireducens DSM 10703]|uniref:Stage V sporulation protein D n=1 Tax=Clostridium acetireducens DSM 10703 TaxID=1121290 RepID=A0A1E8EXD4_9CLOT|nr:penicillin-binding transpeptidase domain-containing protein [Clostridium acetireducens]OFI05431.1 stage V sporulation protein D [Clostridium acetireducens DSM 10703]
MRKYICKSNSKVVGFIFVVIFFILLFKIFKFQYIRADKLSVMADSQYCYKENINELNYLLLDCNGKELLNCNKEYYAVIIPEMFMKNDIDKKGESIFTIIYILRNYNNKYDLTKIQNVTYSSKIYYKIDKNTYEKLKDIKNIKGFYVYFCNKVDRKKAWKVENLITNSKKLQDNTLKSEKSLEMKIYNKTKNNKKPEIIYKKDIEGNIYSKEFNIPKNNINVVSTLDKNIQNKIKEIITNNTYNKYEQIGVILMESSTGKIRGMVQKDDTFPNVNLGAYQGFYPGSIFKTLVEEAALETGKVSLNDKFKCRGLYENPNYETHGSLSLEEAFIVSCNDTFSQIGNKVGYEAIYNIALNQGLFNKILDLEYEKKGKLEVDKPKIKDGSLGLFSIGQNLKITPIQAIGIVNTVVNKGVYIKPNIIEGYVDGDNKFKSRVYIESKRAINDNTADIMKNQMINVVKHGTGKLTYLEYIEIGGKTGTTERIEKKDKEFKEYSDGWFIGFFNLNNKYYSMVVFIENINKNTQGAGNTACPLFKELVEEFSKMNYK